MTTPFNRWDKLWSCVPACVAIYRLRSIAAAAEQLGVDRSTIRRRLRSAEEFLGERLFASDDGKLIATPRGVEILSSFERSEATLRGHLPPELHEQIPSPPVRIAIAPNLAKPVAPIILQLLRDNPSLKIEVLADYRLTEVDFREVDIALRVTRAEPVGSFITKRLADVRGRIYGSRRSELEDPIRVARFQGDRLGLKGPETEDRLIVVGIDAYLDFVKAGGIGRLPDFMTNGDPSLSARTDQLKSEGWALWMLYPAAISACQPYRRVLDRLCAIRLDDAK